MVMDKQLIIVAVKGKLHKQIFGPVTAKVAAGKKKELILSGNWKGWQINLRTQSGYAAVPVINRKLKTFEEKIKSIKL